jgi:hypothetical protein
MPTQNPLSVEVWRTSINVSWMGQGVAVSATIGEQKSIQAVAIARTLDLEFKLENLGPIEETSLQDVRIGGLIWEKRTEAEAKMLQAGNNPEVERALAQTKKANIRPERPGLRQW